VDNLGEIGEIGYFEWCSGTY